jgi:hypothetical protein
MEFNPKRVYFVESKEDDTVLLALEPELRENGHEMCWFDTLRPRIKHGDVIKDEEKSMVFKSQDGAKYRFRMLTLKLYDAKVKDQVDGSPAFSSPAEMHKFYVKNFL